MSHYEWKYMYIKAKRKMKRFVKFEIPKQTTHKIVTYLIEYFATDTLYIGGSTKI